MTRSRLLILPILALLMCVNTRSAGGASEANVVTIGQWERLEVVIRNDRRYDNPYTDVTLDVTYTTPAGDQIQFWGFYDGGPTWKIRFMPHERGTWQYTARFSDGSPGASGSFRVVASDLPGMLQVDETNPVWFSGSVEPLLIRGLHVGDRFFAENWPDEKRRTFLDWVEEQGYNTLSVASHYLNRDAEGRGRGWKTPRLWPLDAAEYRNMERILDELARRRIIIYPFAGFFGQQSTYPHDPEDQEHYVRYTLARIGPYWNLLFNVAGPEPNVREDWMLPAEVTRLGRLIRRLDVFGHPVSVHNAGGDDPYRDSDWSTYGTLQGPKTTDRRKLGRMLFKNHHPDKPLVAQETLWAGNEYHPPYSDDDLRKNAYVINMAAASLIFGDMKGNSSSGFSGTLELDEREQHSHDIIKRVWDFFEDIPYHEMRPRPDLVTAGYCLANPGREYLVYLESRGETDVRVENGPYTARWINAQDTTDQRLAGTTSDGKALRTPEDGDDWLLHLTRGTERESARSEPERSSPDADGAEPQKLDEREPIGRIALSADGNQHDEDDWAASPMALAILAHRDLQPNVVHYAYNDHIWDSAPEHRRNMTTSVMEAGERFGFDTSRFFDAADPQELDASVENLAAEINRSRPGNELWLVLAGPMEAAWKALDAANRQARRYVKCVSHGEWNETHGATDHGGHTYEELIELGCQRVQILDQNSELGETGMSDRDYLNDLGPNMRWLYSRIALHGDGDVSDAGMVYYVITGNETPTRSDLSSYFEE